MKRHLIYFLALAFLINLGFAQKKGKSIDLFDTELSHFEKWNGIAHSSVEGLPEGTYQSDNVHKGAPLGLNNDLKNVFTVITENGEPVLKITGEIYGGLTTKDTYSNYHLSIMFKWGDKKWPPRLDVKRDSGILYHCYGEHGRFWKTWKTSLEYQVQETDLGDFIPISGNTGDPKVGAPLVEIRGVRGEKKGKYDPNSDTYLKKIGYTDAYLEPDAPHGEWNHLEIYVIGNDAVHLVNGKIVMVVENAINPETNDPLVEGQIQIQSEAAECYYKDFTITPIKKFPKFIRKKVRFM
ncbi:MAG: 3-keto-disaccharide hydrolase [Jejuia sp.]